MDDSPEGKVSRKKRYEPTDEDYELSNIGIDEAENGVVICCRYKLREGVKDKMRVAAKSGGPSPDFWSYENNEEKHVFEDKAMALKFITGELTEMWGK